MEDRPDHVAWTWAPPRIEDIEVEDLAHRLATKCRYEGGIPGFYSVAEHCFLLADYALEVYNDRALAKLLLLHDAPEAYVGDVIRPLKYDPRMAGFLEIEREVAEVIARRFGYDNASVFEAAAVKELDSRIIYDEFRLLRPSHLDAVAHLEPLAVPICCLDWEDAENDFLAMAQELGVV